MRSPICAFAILASMCSGQTCSGQTTASGQNAAEKTRADFLRMIERPRVPLAPRIAQEGPEVHFSYASDSDQRVPGILLRPASDAKTSGGKAPAAIVLHGTGGRKEDELPLLRKFAAAGFLAIAIDAPYHGARTAAGHGSAEYQDAILRTYRTGKEHPFLYDTVWDVMRLIDFIETLDGADANRIGAIGISKGGMELYLAAAADPRIKVAVPCIAAQSFRWALDHDSWQSRAGTFRTALDSAARDEGVTVADAAFLRRFYDKVAPGIYGEFDGPAMLPLIAPRPLLTINGEIDARTPMPGLEECFAAIRKAYAGAPDRFRTIIEKNTGHKVNPDAIDEAIAWFAKWL
ncbi:MAG: acetylxylan esterase [Acidobacteriota bacterium]|nr:acetylxylan esterase [Acidobacteriota bacterium]